MKRLARVLAIALSVVGLGPAAGFADTEVGTVTGAAAGLFGGRAVLADVSLDGLEMGTGVFIDSDGSASGHFHAVLLGSSVLGQPRQIAIEGMVSGGAVEPDGQASFGGTATVDLGEGLLSAVPFSVTATASSLGLTLGATTLPAAVLTAGTVTIE